MISPEELYRSWCAIVCGIHQQFDSYIKKKQVFYDYLIANNTDPSYIIFQAQESKDWDMVKYLIIKGIKPKHEINTKINDYLKDFYKDNDNFDGTIQE